MKQHENGLLTYHVSLLCFFSHAVCAFVYNASMSLNGSITSPNYPGLYPRDTECHYFFHGRGSERVHINFTHFDIEGVEPWVFILLLHWSFPPFFVVVLLDSLICFSVQRENLEVLFFHSIDCTSTLTRNDDHQDKKKCWILVILFPGYLSLQSSLSDAPFTSQTFSDILAALLVIRLLFFGDLNTNNLFSSFPLTASASFCKSASITLFFDPS